jgi:Protein of unknown function (DUF2585)
VRMDYSIDHMTIEPLHRGGRFGSWLRRIPIWAYLAAVLLIIAAVAFIELKAGRTAISKSGTIRFWVGQVHSPENSQQIADWYSFSHLIHGFLLYGMCYLMNRSRSMPLAACFLLSVLLESIWEVTENSRFIIDRYRTETLAWDYYGDSVLNSVSDILFAVIGFFLAARLRVWVTISLAIGMELMTAYAIRDNLTLNVIMLVHPFEAIKHWQAGAG